MFKNNIDLEFLTRVIIIVILKLLLHEKGLRL